MPLLPGQILNNRYRVVNLLGQGGFGAIYRAWDLNLNRHCAVKENLDTSRDAEQQFERESSILANLIHPNLVRVTDYFFLQGWGQYLVMDFVEGEDLQEKLQKNNGSLQADQVISWVIQICDALIFLHSQNPPIIHRDIKPANIKITPQGRSVLVDFGIAKIYDAKLRTTMGARAVTPGYSPPEQYGQGHTDVRSDVYALGATLYTALTGQEPPDSVDVLSGNIPPPKPIHILNPSVSVHISDLVEKAMISQRTNRLESVQVLKANLLMSPILVQKPAASLPPGRTSIPLQSSMLPAPVRASSSVVLTSQSKSPIGAALLSFFFLGGAGQIYLGQVKKGIVLILASILTAFVGLNFFVVLFAIVDAYNTAQKINRGISVGDWEFSVGKTAIIIILLMGVLICCCLISVYMLPLFDSILNQSQY